MDDRPGKQARPQRSSATRRGQLHIGQVPRAPAIQRAGIRRSSYWLAATASLAAASFSDRAARALASAARRRSNCSGSVIRFRVWRGLASGRAKAAAPTLSAR